MAQGTGLNGSWNTQLTDVSTTLKEELGSLRLEGGKWYKYVQYSDAAVAGTATLMCYYLSYADNTVSCDISDCTTNIGAGQLVGTIAHLSYGWILIKGISATPAQDMTAGAAGNALTAAGAADGEFDVSAAVTDYVCGVLIDATGSAQVVLLDCPF